MMKQTQFTDPCKACALREVCDPDECGRKLYPLDSNKSKYSSPIQNRMDILEERTSRMRKMIHAKQVAISKVWTRL